MWRWSRGTLLVLMALVVLGLCLAPIVVRADTSATVTIYAHGLVYFPNAPGGFTIWYISDYEVGISWERPVTANMTMIRAAYGRAPEDKDDGYQVYYGTGTNTTDDAVSVASLENVYYRAWSQDVGGNWSTNSTAGNTEGFMSQSFLFVGLIMLGFGLFVAAFRWKDMLLSYSAALTWMAIGFWWLLGDITNFGIEESWAQILVFVPFILAFAVLLRLMNTEISNEASGGKSWKEWGQPPRKSSKGIDVREARREQHKETLRRRRK